MKEIKILPLKLLLAKKVEIKLINGYVTCGTPCTYVQFDLYCTGCPLRIKDY